MAFKYGHTPRMAAEAHDALRRAWGVDYDRHMAAASRAVNQLGERAVVRYVDNGSLVPVAGRPGVFEVRGVSAAVELARVGSGLPERPSPMPRAPGMLRYE